MRCDTLLPMKFAVFAVIFGVMVACTAPKSLTDSEKSKLIQRVSERWRCLERNDYGCAYVFLSPAYRTVFSRQMYENRYFGELERRLTGVKVVAYDSQAAVASVRVGVMSRPSDDTLSASRAIAVVPTNLTESWIWAEGEWWYHDRS